MSPRALWLSVHLPYACRHAGACCTAGWPIPLEISRATAVTQAIEHGVITAPARWLRRVPNQPDDVAGLIASENGHCIFHRPSASARTDSPGELRRDLAEAAFGREGGPDAFGLPALPARPVLPALTCSIHSVLGPRALPTACQHFPRECLIDARGVSVTLSHYCPTAADLLFTHEGAVEILDGPAPVPDGAVEGLDAREALPPLLTPTVLMDSAGFAAWERHMVSWLGGVRNPRGDRGPEDVLTALEADAASLTHWRPANGPLVDAVSAVSARADRACGPTAGVQTAPDWAEEERLRDVARAALPPPLEWSPDPPDLDGVWRDRVAREWPMLAIPVNRFLAAHAFAAWMAYQGSGVASMIRRLRLTLAVLRAEAARVCYSEGGPLTAGRLKQAIRETDRLLVHLVDRQDLARRLS